MKKPAVPEPRQLKSGNWNIQLRREGKSITESTARKCRQAAQEYRRQWEAEELLRLHSKPAKFLPLGVAIDRYLQDNSAIHDPSTQRAYKSYRQHRMQQCMTWNIFEPTCNWQGAINEEYAEVSPKTVKNMWGLITAAMRHANAEPPKIKLRRVVRKEHRYLDYTQIKIFLEAIKGSENELACLLGLHSLRHSELISLRPCDVSLETKTLHIRSSRVLNSQQEYEFKETNKTAKSRRDVPIMIPRLYQLLAQADMNSEFVVDIPEKRLYDWINRVCAANGLPPVGIHGLRHSFASLAYHLGWQKKSTMEIGGWSNSTIVDDIYTHNADLAENVKKMQDYYAE